MAHLDTLSVHAGREDLTALGVHVPPIDLSTTYPIGDITAGGQAYDQLGAGHAPDEAGGTFVYQRLWNPTVARFESAVARLEGCAAGAALATGMATTTAVLLSRVLVGRPHVVAVRPVYGGSEHLLNTGLLGTEVTWTTPQGVAAAITDRTGLVLVETPANPTLELVDLAALTADVRRVAPDPSAVPVLVDNTFATPVLQQPIRHGADLVMHSATKFLGGHGDVMGGVVCGPAELVAPIRSVRALTGALLHPQAAYQLHRGLQTLPTRVRAQQATAEIIASWLAGRAGVVRVLHPSIAGADPLGLVGRQMSGPGSVLAFEVAGGLEAAAALVGRLRLVTHAVSLGGVDTLVEHPAALTHRPVAAEHKVGPGVLRLSVGLESPEDLVADLDQAITAAVEVREGLGTRRDRPGSGSARGWRRGDGRRSPAARERRTAPHG